MALEDGNIDYLKKLEVYSKNFNSIQLEEFENEIFTEKFDRKKRVFLEYRRLKEELSRNMSAYAQYYQQVAEIGKLLRVADLSSDIIDDLYKLIVAIQLSCNMRIRLYTGITMLEDENKLLEYKKTVGEQKNGSKVSR